MYSEVNEKMMDKEFGRHDDIALALKEMYGYFYSCASIKKNTWFEYQKNRWVSVQDGYTLNNKISDEFAQEILKLKTTVMLKTIENGNTDNIDKRGREFASLAKNLKTTSFKNATMDACRNRFYDPDFEKKLNQNTGLVGFNNGVYDLRNRCFRSGCPDDYLTFSVGYDYENRFTENSQEVIEVQNFFESLQIEKEVAIYILVYIASILDGDAEDQNFIMWTGVGSNGKSTIMELLISTLGDYFGMVPITLLTQKRGSSSGATPELADKAGKRLLAMNETEHDDVIHIGYMKELTGGDLILARPLFGDPFYYKPQFHMLLLCNTLPNIPSTDKGTWRRIRAVPFPIEFVSGPCTKPNQKPRDKTLKTKMKNWNKPLIWLLLNVYYPMYKDKVIIKKIDGMDIELKGLDAYEPRAVKEQTEKYKKDIDIHYEFFSSTYKKTGNDKDIIPFSVLFKQFKSWYNEYYDSRNPSKKDLESYFEKNDIKIYNGKIYGIKDINEDEF
jgi:P4 family phage/plasmid primase-like protien